MIYEVRLANTAEADLDRIDEFLAAYSLDLAERGAILLRKASRTLAEMPNRGRRRKGGLRELIVRFGRGGYILRYRVDAEAVVVLRIFHSLEDQPLA